jgi:hypothetical protein
MILGSTVIVRLKCFNNDTPPTTGAQKEGCRPCGRYDKLHPLFFLDVIIHRGTARPSRLESIIETERHRISGNQHCQIVEDMTTERWVERFTVTRPPVSCIWPVCPRCAGLGPWLCLYTFLQDEKSSTKVLNMALGRPPRRIRPYTI